MKKWTTINKSEWARGEWDREFDKVQWIDEDTNLDCLIVRGPSGALCGYVGIPAAHPCFEKDYTADELIQTEVHGGLTFAGACNPAEDPATGICHTGDIANKKVWWLGFDCSHGWDVAPKYDRGFIDPTASYKNMRYVEDECASLAKQLHASA